MPLPFIVKVVYLGKYLILPIVDTIKEYRRKRKAKKAGQSELKNDRIWHNPIEAVQDKRLWVKFTTNFAETVVHAVGALRFGYGFVSRRLHLHYRTHTPDHTHEHELYNKVEFEPWRVVFKETWAWLRVALKFYESQRLEQPAIRDLLKRSKRWKRISFDGLVIAAWVPNKKVKLRVAEYCRRGSDLRLRLLYGGSAMVEVIVLKQRKIIQHLQIFETEIQQVQVLEG